MFAAISHIRVGSPVCFQGLSVFPLFGGSDPPVEYVLASEAIARGSVSVQEISEAGSVPELLVENKGDVRVLFLEGEELVGAKQNRILNTSLLVAARSTVKVPVSCVEQGRWGYRSPRFRSGGSHSAPKLRYLLKKSVSRSAINKRGHRADQAKIWEEVARQQAAMDVASPTHAMADTYESAEPVVADYRRHLGFVNDACGLAVAICGRIAAIDHFDKPMTCQKVWERLLSGYVLEAMETRDCEAFRQAELADVEKLLHVASTMDWRPTDAVGEGEEYRGESRDQVHGSALLLGTSAVHTSIVVGSPE